MTSLVFTLWNDVIVWADLTFVCYNYMGRKFRLQCNPSKPDTIGEWNFVLYREVHVLNSSVILYVCICKWEHQQCPLYRGVLISGVTFKRGSTESQKEALQYHLSPSLSTSRQGSFGWASQCIWSTVSTGKLARKTRAIGNSLSLCNLHLPLLPSQIVCACARSVTCIQLSMCDVSNPSYLI